MQQNPAKRDNCFDTHLTSATQVEPEEQTHKTIRGTENDHPTNHNHHRFRRNEHRFGRHRRKVRPSNGSTRITKTRSSLDAACINRPSGVSQRKHRNDLVHADRRARAEARKAQASYDQPAVDVSAWFDSSGNIQWPVALSETRFAEQRVQVETALNNGEMSSLQQTASALRTALRGDIRELSPRDYLAAKRFLVYLESSNVDTPTVLVAANR